MLSNGSILGELASILYFIVFPILALAGIGYMLKRVFSLELDTLKAIIFYAILPAVIFVSVVESTASARQIGLIAAAIFVLLLVQAVVAYFVSVLFHVQREYRSAMMLSSSLINLGNFGIPLQELTFRSSGLSETAVGYNAYLIVSHNLLTFTGGVFVAARGVRRGNMLKELKHVLRFPPIYALALGLIVLAVESATGTTLFRGESILRPVWDVLLQLRRAFVTVALIMLGAQLADIKPGRHDYPVLPSVLTRILLGPLLGIGIALTLGLQGLIGQVFVLAAASPTAVNSVLLSLEFDNHPDLAARCVFYTTVFSPLSISAVLLVMRSGLFPMLSI